MKTGYGDFIRKHRLESGFKKQKDLADKTGISAATISRIENEIQRPEVETLKLLAPFLASTSLVELMVECGYWNDDELLDSNSQVNELAGTNNGQKEKKGHELVGMYNGIQKGKKATPTSNEEEFVDKSIDLTDDEILEQFDLKIDGRSLTEDEAKGIIAYVRTLRQMK